MADDTFTQADIDKLSKSIDDLKEQVETERAKNTGLLDDLKKAQRDLRSKQEVKPEDLSAAEERADKAEARIAELEKENKTLTTRAEKAEQSLEGETAAIQKLLVDNGLNQALAEAGVTDPDYLAAAKSMMAGTAQVVTEGNERIVKVGDKALTDHIKEWAGTEGAKKFITAANNSGGGAPGGKGGDGGKTLSRSAFDQLSQSERMAFSKDGGKVVETA